MSTTMKIERVRELCEQVGNAQAAGLVDDVGDPELCELVALIADLDKSGALAEKTAYVHVVDVFDRTEGTYVFANLDDAAAFEATVNGDRAVSMGSACYRTEEPIFDDRADALKLIAAECEATSEAEAASLESDTPVAMYAWKKGDDAPYPDKLLCVEYYATASEQTDEDAIPRAIRLWVGLNPENGSVNVDAGRERLEAEGWEVTDWGAA